MPHSCYFFNNVGKRCQDSLAEEYEMSAAGSFACRYKTQTTGEIALQFLPSKAAQQGSR